MISNLAQVLSGGDVALQAGESSHDVIFARRFFHIRSVSSSKRRLFSLGGCDWVNAILRVCLYCDRPREFGPFHFDDRLQPLMSSTIRSLFQRLTLGVSLEGELENQLQLRTH